MPLDPPPDGPRIAGASRSPRLTVYEGGEPIGRIYEDGSKVHLGVRAETVVGLYARARRDFHLPPR
jgi:hypothetical protein